MSDRRTGRNATVAEGLLPRIRVIDAVHPLFGQPLEVSPSGMIRRIGWIRVVLPDGRHRWVPQKGHRAVLLAIARPRPGSTGDEITTQTFALPAILANSGNRTEM